VTFRLRVLLLVVLVAVTASAATAWLTLRQASKQIAESQTVDREQVELITSQLREYGERHGTWEGVAKLVRDLHAQTDQRIHLTTEFGEVLVDTDTEQGRTARPLGESYYVVDPRPQLTLSRLATLGQDVPADLLAKRLASTMEEVATAVVNYRYGVKFAACLTRNGIDVTTRPGRLGVPEFAFVTARNPEFVAIDFCRTWSESELNSKDLARAQLSACLDSVVVPAPGRPIPPTEQERLACLARSFTQQISDIAPVPVRVYLGARDDPKFTLATGEMLAAVAGVMLVIILGTAVLSHRVLRPIGTLTAAAHRLGQGDLASRVPVSGSDELAALGRSFNRMADSLQRSEERQRQLVADVAHELRTPLANLRGYLEALADGVIDPEPELFASLHEEAVLQQRIVDDLQDLALAEAGNLAYNWVTVDLAELLETCRTAHLARAEADGVALTVHIEQSEASGNAVPAVLVRGDPDRLRQVLGNLITNALRATSSGGSVSLHANRSGDTAVIRVADTGTGIEPEALPYIFDRFWRADPARGRRSGGSGLGLAIARQIVIDHGGTIAVESQVGIGTTFTITLPALDEPPTVEGAIAGTESTVEASGSWQVPVAGRDPDREVSGA